MANKHLGLGMLVILLVFGMTVVGCDDGSTNNDSGGDWNKFVGHWQTAGGSDLAFYPDLTVAMGGGTMVGVYKYSGNTATLLFNTNTYTAT